MSSKKIAEGPRQVSVNRGQPTGDQISYKQPAAIVPFPDQNPIYGAPGTPRRTDMLNPEAPTTMVRPLPGPVVQPRASAQPIGPPKPQKK